MYYNQVKKFEHLYLLVKIYDQGQIRVQVNFQEPLPRPWLAPQCYLANGNFSGDSNILKVLAGSKIWSSEHRLSFPGIRPRHIRG